MDTSGEAKVNKVHTTNSLNNQPNTEEPKSSGITKDVEDFLTDAGIGIPEETEPQKVSEDVEGNVGTEGIKRKRDEISGGDSGGDTAQETLEPRNVGYEQNFSDTTSEGIEEEGSADTKKQKVEDTFPSTAEEGEGGNVSSINPSDLEGMSRKDLQQFAKQQGIKANQKTSDLIMALKTKMGSSSTTAQSSETPESILSQQQLQQQSTE